MTKNTTSTFSLPDRDGLEARFGVRVASMLGERAQSTAPDIGERLRFAREQALSRAQAARRQVQLATAPVLVSRGRSAALGSPLGWWFKLGSAAPLALLVLGLAGIAHVHDKAQIAAVAEVDAALLSDDLPPDAYTDPGFAEYLKTTRE
ncbi:MAG: DUF3619 family protein [Burkholderiales bacterium]|nr:DUF3619 family protein [Burkholderiales bacterium]